MHPVSFLSGDFIMLLNAILTLCGQNPFRLLLGKSLVLNWIYREDLRGMEEKLNQTKQIPSVRTSDVTEWDYKAYLTKTQ